MKVMAEKARKVTKTLQDKMMRCNGGRGVIEGVVDTLKDKYPRLEKKVLRTLGASENGFSWPPGLQRKYLLRELRQGRSVACLRLS